MNKEKLEKINKIDREIVSVSQDIGRLESALSNSMMRVDVTLKTSFIQEVKIPAEISDKICEMVLFSLQDKLKFLERQFEEL